ncbi:monovalent cation/H(+) antiporter subunit G [Nesterenkonia sphaerica]|uniref:Monovalent cation/H(+) antiporter subunit G n=2 Tax=Nesterenkonia sphaerica TaxID=1804988 RepID=A0A5R9AMS4_9MICC|nr:monovalent cation/H(+) antiporter subunit G [Nesterenkonia sphaerica]
MLGGAFFFSVGTLGLIRFPDVRSRLHGLTKADNLGLGLILGGAALWLGDWSVAGLMLLCWLFALAGSSASAHVIAALETDHAEQREPVHHAGEPPTPADDAATAQVPDPEQES